ncbi:hypothetical protein BBH99_13695 [Chryseobacterium contaminans]|uniref:VanZ like family protein n=1 Tax=Chryseobacterium contaminans TaxID=1423959 RepID=A0A1M6XIY2_9FLAO|nr:hypothetical protein [Chryseobacterium contaminans]OCA71849.1 hypothetical protein BBH99_13695 [Chryseobacterium contaminans]SHL05765.1 hypothetical protein SAMN05444407_10287 [Chryseobacterium contaminans]
MAHKSGEILAQIFLFLFPIIVFYLFRKNKTINKRKSVFLFFLLSWLIYVLPMWLRNAIENKSVLFWFGFIPNFGCVMALPLAFLYNNELTYQQAKSKLLKLSFISLFIILLYELIQLLPGYGYFDIKDILMTFLGFITVNIIFRMNEKYFCKAFE